MFPVVLTGLILILHPRVGARATAAVIANTISGTATACQQFARGSADVDATDPGASPATVKSALQSTGSTGWNDVDVSISLGMTLVFMATCLAVVGWMFRTGYRLKT